MKILGVNFGWRNEYGSDLRSYEHYLSSSENKAWKKIFLQPQFIYMIFLYLQSFIHPFEALFGTNKMTSSQ